jgi:hypothetical protein
MEPNTQPDIPANDPSEPVQSLDDTTPLLPSASDSPSVSPSPLTAESAEPLINSLSGPSTDEASVPDQPLARIHQVVHPPVQPHAVSLTPAAPADVAGSVAPISDMTESLAATEPALPAAPRLGEHGQSFGHRVIMPSQEVSSVLPAATDSPTVISSIPVAESGGGLVVANSDADDDNRVSNLNTNFHPNVYPQATSGAAAALTNPDTPLNAMAAMRPEPVAPKKRRKQLLLSGVAVVVLLAGGTAAYYFGYYANPSVIYAQSLKDTGKGYDALVDYATTQSKIKYQSLQANGSFNFKTSGFSTDGTMTIKSDGGNGELTFNVGDGVGRLDADIRTIKSTDTTPDVYVKVGGLTDLGSLLGSSQLNTGLNQLNNTWIDIDHTTIENLQNSISTAAGGSGATSTSAASVAPSEAQITDELRAFGQVNQQYLFSTNKSKAVTIVVKKYGMQTVDGHKTYHYQVTLDKANLKAYITAQQKALEASQLGTWLKQNNYDDDVQKTFGNLQQSADSVQPTDTFDVWADVSRRVIYKLRFSDPSDNPAENYVDIGLNYKGGDNYPFFISGQSKADGDTTTGSLVATLNTTAHSVDLQYNLVDSGNDNDRLTGSFKFQPSTSTIQIATPTNAIPLTQAANDLGVGDLLDSLSQQATTSPGGTSGTDSLLDSLQAQTITQ